jgi:hypothetical protein
MKRIAMSVFGIVVAGWIAIFASGCSKESSPGDPESVASALTATGVQINCGSPTASGVFAADEFFTGSAATINHANAPINTSKVTNPAPANVYWTGHVGDFTYTVPGFVAGKSATVRLHFAETYFTKTGQRTFNVTINGKAVLNSFDIVAAAGGEYFVNIQTFTTTANANGAVVIVFKSVTNQSLVSGIEVTGTPANSCATNNGGCDINATCTSTGPGTNSCACKTGFTGNGRTCTQINSCATNNGGCDINATCTSTGPGTNSCTCNSGFTGNGITCTQINPCTINNGGCDAHATCVFIQGDMACNCNTGWSGPGDTCWVDPCVTNHGGCDVNATCYSSAPGEADCSCEPGFSGNGTTCSPELYFGHHVFHATLPQNPLSGPVLYGTNINGPNQVAVYPILFTCHDTSTNTTSVPDVQASDLQNLYGFVQSSGYYRWIRAQYGLADLVFGNAVTVSLGNCSTNVTTATFLQVLKNAIATNGLTDGDGSVSNAIYALHFPPKDNPLDGDNNPVCGAAGCAYNAGKAGDFSVNTVLGTYYVMPSYSSSACSGTVCSEGGNVGAVQWRESHELIEALSDNPIGWGWEARGQQDPSANGNTGYQGQIGDMCNGQYQSFQNGAGATIKLQAIWSNASNTCQYLAPGAVGDIAGPQFSGASSIFYGGTAPFAPAAQGMVFATRASGDALTATNKTAAYNRSGNWSFFETGLSDSSSCPNCFYNFAKTGGTPGSGGVWYALGDFSGDGAADVALTGPSGWATVPVAASAAQYVTSSTGFIPTNGGFITSLAPSNLKGLVTYFPQLGAQHPLPPVTGDFNGDGYADIAFVGGPGWGSFPVAYSAGNTISPGTFWATNNADGGFNGYIASSNGLAKVVAGDFNGDGYSDLALVGLLSSGAPAQYIVVSLSVGDGTFVTGEYQNFAAYNGMADTSDFNAWASQPGVQAVAGDFNGDGLSDIALMRSGQGANHWGSIPIAFGNGGYLGSTGSPGQLAQFVITNNASGATFANLASTTGAQLVAGDFDGDGISDLALTGGTGWKSIPTAFSLSTESTAIASLGAFTVTNQTVSAYPAYPSDSGVFALSASQAY